MPNFGKASALRDELTPMLALIAALSSAGAWTFGWGEWSEPRSSSRLRRGLVYKYSADPDIQTTLGGAVSSATLILARYSAKRQPPTVSPRTV
jgi:hypothetical protein